MDRLPWSRWHWLVILGLGTVWVLDGVEVTIVGAIASRLQDKQTLALSAFDIAFGGTCYIIGAAIGAIGFGYLTDRLGRKKLFIVTLAVYLAATVATAFTWSAASFWIFRMLTGLGIGGEYAAINSAIDELIPARARGWVDLAINGSYWLGASAGAALSFVLLDKSLFAINLGWRLAFGLGAAMGLAIMFVRRNVPESPRWLIIHGREDEAEKLVELDRGARQARHRRARARRPRRRDRDRAAQGHQRLRGRAHAVQALSAALDPGLHAHGHPGLHLQRGHLHLLDRPDHVLQGLRLGRARLSDPVRDRQLRGRAAARAGSSTRSDGGR